MICGVRLVEHIVNPDHRGTLATISRESETGLFSQWNWVNSVANVLRGVHAHQHYDELYAFIAGRMFVMLKDARRWSATFGVEQSFWSDEIGQRSLLVPRGVAHAIFFSGAGTVVYGLSRAWTGEGELCCHWTDPSIKVSWPARAPLLSEKDAAAGTFSEMVAALQQHRSDQNHP